MTAAKKSNDSQKPFKIGAKVKWTWMGRSVQGSIKSVYLKPVRKMLGGVQFVRNGSTEHPAYLVQSKAGRNVLKLHRELSLAREKD